MKVTLEMELNIEATDLLEERKGHKPTEEEIKEELTQMLFEVCEDWAIRGDEPDLIFS